MPIVSKLLGLGLSPHLASRVTGTVNATEVTAGTTQAGATLLSLDDIHNIKTSQSNGGVILPPGNGTTDGMQPGDSMWVFNNTTNTIKVYPPGAAGTINAGSAAASISLTTLQKGLFVSLDGTAFTALVS